jgi:hypothetical protein
MATIWRMADVLGRELETMLRDRVLLAAEETEQLHKLRVAELRPLREIEDTSDRDPDDEVQPPTWALGW